MKTQQRKGRSGRIPRGRDTECVLCGHPISLAGALRAAGQPGWRCRDGKGCKKRRRNVSARLIRSQQSTDSHECVEDGK